MLKVGSKYSHSQKEKVINLTGSDSETAHDLCHISFMNHIVIRERQNFVRHAEKRASELQGDTLKEVEKTSHELQTDRQIDCQSAMKPAQTDWF